MVDTQCVHLSQLHYFQLREMLHLFSDKSSPSYQLLFNLTATLRSLATRLHHTQDRKTQTLTPPSTGLKQGSLCQLYLAPKQGHHQN